MKYLTLISIFLLVTSIAVAQSKTTELLNKKFSDANVFFFYNNTLRMLNQDDDKDFDALIRDIEKMKLLWIDKSQKSGSWDYKKIVSDYKSESFETIMTSRHEGKNFDIFVKDEGGKTKGMLVLVNDSSRLYVLDIVGRISLDKITKLYSTLNASTEIGNRLKALTNKNEESEHIHISH